jgi:hypothetical protein
MAQGIVFWIFLILASLFGDVMGDDFSDLKEGEEKVYGSKKREKYKSTAFFWEIEDWEGHYSETIFWVYNFTSYPKYKSTSFFPIYSQIESKIDERKKKRLFNFVTKNIGSDYDSYVFPFAAWGNNKIEKTDYFTLLPLFHVGFKENPEDNYFKLLTPLFYYEKNYLKESNNSQTPNQEIEEREIISIIYGYHSKKFNGKENYSHSFPILPIIYFSKQENNKHLNLFWVFNSEWNDRKLTGNFFFPFYYYSSPVQSSDYFFLSPIYYKDKTQNEDYTHYLSMLYTWETQTRGWNLLGLMHSERDKDNLKKNYIFPFYFYEEKDSFISLPYTRFLSNSGKDSFGFGPFYTFWDNSEYSGNWFLNYYSDSAKSGETDRLVFFPVYDSEKYGKFNSFSIFYLFSRDYQDSKLVYSRMFPFYSYEKEEQNENYNFLLGIVGRSYNPEGELVGSRLFPFYSYQKADKTSSGYSGFFGLYGKEFDEKGDTKHARFIPFYKYNRDESLFATLYYRNAKDDLSGEGMILSPVYNRFWNKESESKNILIYYNQKSLETDHFFTTYFPIYYSWKGKMSEGNTFLPIWINYKNVLGDEYKINILGLARTQQTGFLRPELDIKSKGDRYYLDSDVSWFHSLFRISTRISAKNPFYNIPKEFADPPEEQADQESTNPSVTKKKSFTREDSNFFYGWTALFYAISYEKGDTKKHFRMFPLMWFTWDEKNEDRLILFPPILPLVFYYNTPEVQYMAFVPFFGRQKTDESKIDSILLFGYIGEQYKEENRKETSIVWPIFNRYSTDLEKGYRIFPLFWDKTRKQGEVTHHKNFSFLHFYKSAKGNGIEENSFLTWGLFRSHLLAGPKERNTWFFPIFYFHKDSYIDGEAKREEVKINTWSLFHYYDSDLSNMEGKKKYGDSEWITPLYIGGNKYRDSETPTEKFRLYPPLLFYTSVKNEEDYWNFAFLLRRTKSDKTTYLGIGPFFDLIGYEGLDKQKLADSKFWFIPIFYRFKEESGSDDGYKNKSSVNYFFPFIFISKSELAIEGKKQSSEETFFSIPYSYTTSKQENSNIWSRTRFLPIPMLYTKEREGYSFWRLLLFISKENDKANSESEFSIWPIIPVYYQSSTLTSSHTNIFGVVYDNKKVDKNYKRFFLIPYWHSEEVGYRKYTHVIPFYFSAYSENYYSMFMMGLYREKMQSSDYWNFLFLGIYDRQPDYKKSSLSFLFNSIKFERNEDRYRSSMFYGFLYDVDWDPNYSKYSFLWTYYKKDKNSKDLNLFPIYGQAIQKEYFEWSFYPLLSFYEDSRDHKKILVGFGSLFYQKVYKQEDNRYTSILTTLLYEHEYYKNPSGRVEERSILPFGFLYYHKKVEGVNVRENQSLLWGAVYLKEKKPENDYHRYGSLWGWLWQYEYEEQTDYQKFSILKIFSREIYKGKTRIMGIKID